MPGAVSLILPWVGDRGTPLCALQHCTEQLERDRPCYTRATAVQRGRVPWSRAPRQRTMAQGTGGTCRAKGLMRKRRILSFLLPTAAARARGQPGVHRAAFIVTIEGCTRRQARGNRGEAHDDAGRCGCLRRWQETMIAADFVMRMCTVSTSIVSLLWRQRRPPNQRVEGRGGAVAVYGEKVPHPSSLKGAQGRPPSPSKERLNRQEVRLPSSA